jgi:hypothetical protein
MEPYKWQLHRGYGPLLLNIELIITITKRAVKFD